ncbi:hypothetical protein PUR71_14910 [Streptomyces sp. SP17BM10]|uniref:hypothetical protein n=1 Tax=Streptomyces sp. SP17BM10 TaxID=3002530 RepID=UPI002E778B97|nr:hypothetical protein [Streptomyces sp. SP17BM10]MEE1784178.1 hypothetical protein [Streptomyces sp. SP17BM10]
MTVPPPPTEPPTAGMPPEDARPAGDGVVDAVVAEWWRKDGPRIPAPAPGPADAPPVHTPVPVGAGHAGPPSMEEAARTFWGPAREIFAEQATAIASQVGQQVTQLLSETEAQRYAREQVEYEALIARQRAERDAAFKAAGETAAQRAERHRVEDVLTPDRPLHRQDLVGLVDLLGARITETPEERTARLEAERELAKRRARAEEDARLAVAGETPEQRTKRHRQQRLADEREARTRARRQRRQAARAHTPTDRTRRFRRWCTLTAISAIAGYSTGLVQMIAPGGPFVGLFLAAAGALLDLLIRDRGRLRVSEVRGGFPLLLLIAVRVPVASGLAVALGLDHALAYLPLYR